MNTRRRDPLSQAGVTLVELIMAIVIVSVAFVGLMTAYSRVVSRSADPLIYQQSLAIANSFMEEIVSKPYPDGFSGSCPAPPADRALFTTVCDYHGYSDTVIRDVAGNDLGLPGYGVSVAVTADGNALSLPSNNDGLRVVVSVSHPLGDALPLSSYRARY